MHLQPMGLADRWQQVGPEQMSPWIMKKHQKPEEIDSFDPLDQAGGSSFFQLFQFMVIFEIISLKKKKMQLKRREERFIHFNSYLMLWQFF